MALKHIDMLARDWPHLTEDSVVFEIGAYKGQLACDIYDKYKCNVYAFEPQDWAYDILWDESLKRSGLFPFHFGLGPESKVETFISYGTDSCTAIQEGAYIWSNEKHEGFVRDIREFLRTNGINHIDLMLINIEGYEYGLVKYLITSGIIHSIDFLCVQWHTYVDPDGSKYAWIIDYLSRFFTVQFDHFPTLTAWRRNQ